MKCIHIQNTDKFIEPYIDFINGNFNPSNHIFAVIKSINKNRFKKDYKNVIYIIGNKKVFSLIYNLYRCDKIILHGLFNAKITLLLFFQPWLLKKCYWIIYGADLYAYLERGKNFKTRINNFIKSYIIRRFKGFITHIEGDYKLAKVWYKARGKHYYSFIYPSNMHNEIELSVSEKKTNTTYIQIGNSADPSNNHIEIFKQLNEIYDQHAVIICPLSYGNAAYANEIIRIGKDFYGNNFIPLTEFIPFDEYLKLLSKIDIAIFNHKRQQAVGNITSLLGLGKKVYIREDITTWDFCREHNLKVYGIENQLKDIFEPIPIKEKKKNMLNVREKFSEEKLIQDWNKIFSE